MKRDLVQLCERVPVGKDEKLQAVHQVNTPPQSMIVYPSPEC